MECAVQAMHLLLLLFSFPLLLVNNLCFYLFLIYKMLYLLFIIEW